MEFKEAIKIRRRICDYYVECDDCPLYKPSRYCKNFPMSEEEIEEYEKILEEWAKEHPVVTNVDKYIEVMKNTFGGTKFDKDVVHLKVCPKCVGKEIDSNECSRMYCSECLKWWDEEYREPEKEKNK